MTFRALLCVPVMWLQRVHGVQSDVTQSTGLGVGICVGDPVGAGVGGADGSGMGAMPAAAISALSSFADM
jgi:hypothetical protein